MGCGNSKTAPDGCSKDKKDIKSIFSLSSSDPGKEKLKSQQGHDSGNGRKSKNKWKFVQKTNKSGQSSREMSTKTVPSGQKIQKYRATFDPRVTAKYDIKALIGRGSFSRVVRVEHRVTRQPYAIKMIDAHEGREVFETELAVLRRVLHSYIVHMVEVFESKDRIYMVMELATGGELFDRIVAKGSFTERDATRVLQMVLDGVRYLHSLGITHRDLKPENLLYYHPGYDSKILITDFGLASTRKAGDDVTMKTTCGTPEYIAPEILLRKPYTNAVDMWAIGVITYILLSGEMPFDEESKTRLYRLILKANYNFSGEHWRDISPQAKDFIERLLTVATEQRLAAVDALTHPWVKSNAAQSNLRNLHRAISQNLMKRQSIRSSKSSRSSRSNRSSKSAKSLRSQHGRVQPQDLDEIEKELLQNRAVDSSCLS
ncbi:PREDICTED: serine/threonine-protein kinase H1 homolog [Priapulus caudatus]|uniref:Serine/threonine-protein kinase H1 homolog n=1 Tax=Priapulus caudatus TaxID=37621 RepID=A0ABM1EFA5_PRICU|nr:PREDICTED: serine/threonine-protein kinase H1 homolog [Priapulus caudatus]